jgi:hypothetical protein
MHLGWKANVMTPLVCRFFQTYGSHFKTLGTNRVAKSKFHMNARKSTPVIMRHAKNLVARATRICAPLNDAFSSSNHDVRE